MSEKKTFFGIELSQNPYINYLGAIIVVLVVALNLINGYFSSKDYDRAYPSVITHSSKGILFDLNFHLYYTDKNGNIINKRSYQELDINDLYDVEIVGNELMMVDERGHLHRCSLPSLECHKLLGIDIPSHYKSPIDLIAINEYYFDMIYKYRINRYSKDGKVVATLSFKEEFDPYRGFAHDNEIFVINKHNRIISFDKNQTTQIVPKRNYKIKSKAKIRHFTLDSSENLYLLAPYSKPMFIDSSSLNRTIDQDAIKELHLTHAQEPINFIPYKEGILFLDRAHSDILYLKDNNQIELFGDNELRQLITKIQEDQLFYQKANEYIRYTILIILLLTFIVAYIDSNAKDTPLIQSFQNDIAKDYLIEPSKTVPQSHDGVVWLSPLEDSFSIDNIKFIYYTIIVVSFIALISLTIFHLLSDEVSMWSSSIVVKLISFLLLIMAVKKSRDSFESKILGVDDIYLYIKHNANTYKAKPQDIYYTQDMIYLDGSHIYVALRGKRHFDLNQLRHYIYPKLRDASYISPLAMVGLQLKNRDGELWLYAGSFILFVIS